jgi:LPXTG-motif cell wall-anchored protein
MARADMRLLPPITGSDEADVTIVFVGLGLALAAALWGIWRVRRKPYYLIAIGIVLMLGVVLNGLCGMVPFIAGLLLVLRGVYLQRRRSEALAPESIEPKPADAVDGGAG